MVLLHVVLEHVGAVGAEVAEAALAGGNIQSYAMKYECYDGKNFEVLIGIMFIRDLGRDCNC